MKDMYFICCTTSSTLSNSNCGKPTVSLETDSGKCVVVFSSLVHRFSQYQLLVAWVFNLLLNHTLSFQIFSFISFFPDIYFDIDAQSYKADQKFQPWNPTSQALSSLKSSHCHMSFLKIVTVYTLLQISSSSISFIYRKPSTNISVYDFCWYKKELAPAGICSLLTGDLNRKAKRNKNIPILIE